MFLDLTVNPTACGGRSFVVRVYGPNNDNFVKRLEDVTSARFITGPSELQQLTFPSLHKALVQVTSWKSLNAYEQTYYNGTKVNTIRRDPARSFSPTIGASAITKTKTMRSINKKQIQKCASHGGPPRLYDCIHAVLPILDLFEQQTIDADVAGAAVAHVLKTA